LAKGLADVTQFALFLKMNFTKADLQKETSYKTSRSGGKGGQNVNKVSSKVELLFSITSSALFTDEEKEQLTEKLQNRFNKDGYVQVICDEERSQYLNKEKAIGRLTSLLVKALQKPKVRKPTKVSKAAKAARLHSKKIQSTKKEGRGKRFEVGD
jgi:ribosome-associated protein